MKHTSVPPPLVFHLATLGSHKGFPLDLRHSWAPLSPLPHWPDGMRAAPSHPLRDSSWATMTMSKPLVIPWPCKAHVGDGAWLTQRGGFQGEPTCGKPELRPGCYIRKSHSLADHEPITVQSVSQRGKWPSYVSTAASAGWHARGSGDAT